MDPTTDLPPMTAQPATYVADQPPPPPSNDGHPPYAEMIIAAIAALKDKDGSSRQAISKYIEKEYANLSPTHSILLTHHLKRLKNDGQLIMVKHSYILPPRPVPFQPHTLDISYTAAANANTNGNATTAGVNLENSPTTGSFKRKPGRPSKLKPDLGLGLQVQVPSVQAYEADVPSYQPQFQYHYDSGSDFQGNSAGGSGPLFASLGLGDDAVPVQSIPPMENSSSVTKRGRGRPPKLGGFGGAPPQNGGSGGAPPQNGGSGGAQPHDGGSGDGEGEIQGSGPPVRKPKMMSVSNGGRVKRGRGRPRRIGIGAVTVPLSGNVMRPRGRPKGSVRPNVTINGGVGKAGLGSRRPGRPSLNKIAQLTGNTFSRPSKRQVGPGTAVLVTDPRQLVVYQELKSKYELLQSKVKQVASVVKSCIDPNYGNAALGALQELEALANAPSIAQTLEPEQEQEPPLFYQN